MNVCLLSSHACSYPLDPPLRSRFQARAINPTQLGSKMDSLAMQVGCRLALALRLGLALGPL